MAPVMATALEVLADEIRKLSPANRLRLAADLLEQGKVDLAYSIANEVVLSHLNASEAQVKP